VHRIWLESPTCVCFEQTSRRETIKLCSVFLPLQSGVALMTNEEILQKVAAGEISPDDDAKLIKSEAPKRGSLYCKVSEKGAISVYGLQRMPVTLYVEQWVRLLDFSEDLKSFMKENDSKLKRKET
jgi:hypothetical protein